MMNKWLIRWVLVLWLSVGLEARAVDYQLPNLNGQIQSLDQYKGKWLIVNYWATWCDTCMKELPDLISLYEGHKDGDITVIGINFESISPDRLKNFVAEHSIPFTILRSEPVPVTPLGPVPALPATYIVDPDGKTVAGEVGIVTRKNLEDYIEQKKKEAGYVGIKTQLKGGDQG